MKARIEWVPDNKNGTRWKCVDNGKTWTYLQVVGKQSDTEVEHIIVFRDTPPVSGRKARTK